MVKDKYGAQLNVQIPPELKKDLEKIAVEKDLKIKEVVAAALENYIFNTKANPDF